MVVTLGRRYPWKFLMGVCHLRFSKSWPYFRPKNDIFYTHFQTWPLKSIPILRPGFYKIMSSLSRLEQQQKIFSQNPFRIRIFLFLSHSFGIETINLKNTFVHSHSSLEKHTRFQTKMSSLYPFSDQSRVCAQKPFPLGWQIPIWLTYISPPTPSSWT